MRSGAKAAAVIAAGGTLRKSCGVVDRPGRRKHIRIVAHATSYGGLAARWSCRASAVVDVYRSGSRCSEKKRAAKVTSPCACGAVGAPGSLGWWANLRPCFDAAPTAAPVGGFGQFDGWLRRWAFRFTPTGNTLWSESDGGSEGEPHDGAVVTEAKVGEPRHAMGRTRRHRDGEPEGSVFRWRHDTDEVEAFYRSADLGRVALSPDASGWRSSAIRRRTSRPHGSVQIHEFSAPEPFRRVQFARTAPVAELTFRAGTGAAPERWCRADPSRHVRGCVG